LAEIVAQNVTKAAREFFAVGRGARSTGPMSLVSGEEASLRGRLEQFGLATVLTFLDLERRSGELLLVTTGKTGKLGQAARLWLSQGRVVRVRKGHDRIEGSRRTRRSAIYELLGWEQGHFAFTHGDTSELEDEIGAPTTMLLIEAARRTDELDAADAP
jgi:hypothetical protein